MIQKAQINDISVESLIQRIGSDCIQYSLQGIHCIQQERPVFYQECLARLVSSDGSIYSAGQFLPAIAKNNGMADFDLCMIEKAGIELKSNLEAIVGLNISVETISSKENWSIFKERLTILEVNPKRLILELTETEELSDLDVISTNLTEAREMGYLIAADDFGAGYFNLNQLERLKFDIIKIDAGIVQRAENIKDESLLCMVGLAKCFAEVIVVEGIETVNQLYFAEQAGATHVQGYHISVPIFRGVNKGQSL